MPTYQNVNDTIEGEKVEVVTRRLESKGLVKHPVLGKTMIRYSCDRNSSAEVKEQGVVPEDEKLRNATSYYHRAVGDRLECDAMSVYIDQKKPVRSTVKEGVSGRHGASKFSTSKQTVANITTPLDNALKRLGMNSNKPLDNK